MWERRAVLQAGGWLSAVLALRPWARTCAQDAAVVRVPLAKVANPWTVVPFTAQQIVETREGKEAVEIEGYLIRLPQGAPGYAETVGGLIAVARNCPHEGCPVAPDPDTANGLFLNCPCHKSRFAMARAGAVVGGPAPRKPFRFALSVAGGEAVIGSLERAADRVILR